MAYSSVGKARLAVHVALFFVNLIVLALSARVNIFQEYFFVADLFPLALSIITLVLLTISTLLDLAIENSILARAPTEIGLFGILSVFWLAFNAFSTSRWRHIPLQCDSIPSSFTEEISWCKDLQALKSFVWIEWLIFFLAAVFTLRYALVQHSKGSKHIWSTALSRYTPRKQQFDLSYPYPQLQSMDFDNYEKSTY